jgi:MoxR-like ATPase
MSRNSLLKELAAEGRAVIDRASSTKFLTVIALAAGRPELLLGEEGVAAPINEMSRSHLSCSRLL